jgi:hypothetical protein
VGAADEAVTQLRALTQRQLHRLLGPACERHLRRRASDRRGAGRDLLADAFELQTERLQRAGDRAALREHREQHVLGPDLVVSEEARLLLREHHHPPGLVGEPFEHAASAPRNADGVPGCRP